MVVPLCCHLRKKEAESLKSRSTSVMFHHAGRFITSGPGLARTVVKQTVVGSAVVGRAFLLQTVVARIIVK
jgi:hypothetical protein